VIQFQQAPPERVTLIGKLLAAFGLTAAVCVLLLWLVGRGLRRVREQAPWKETPRAAGGDSALAMAAVQAVIQRLREQEKELERLHRAERQRAEESEQLSATIMRDMATGLLVANAQGIITESNPAAKAVLAGIAAIVVKRMMGSSQRT
jgi:PAS domain-containing protein